MRRLPRLLAAAALCLPAAAVQAAQIARVDIVGLDEAMAANVRLALSAEDAIGRELTGRRLAYLVRQADDETREALQPFGYYDPVVTVERTRGDGPVVVTVTVSPGAPVLVREATVAITGDGADDRYLREDLAAFEPSRGEVFDHRLYEASKATLVRRLAERGYFDAAFTSRRVEVTRAGHAADIDLSWDSGDRYAMGRVDFVQEPEPIIRESLLDRLVYWEEGSYYHQARIDRLRESLSRLDYYATIDVQPRPADAVDGLVPVDVTLTAAPRNVYTAGVGYGTDSGGLLRLGMERRYVNDRGHKALGQLDYAEKRKTLTLQYRIPAFAWLDGWYTFSAQAADEQTDYIDTRRVEGVASRSGEVNEYLTAVVAVHALRERWAYELPGDAAQDFRYATFSYPSIHADYVDADDLVFPRDALAGSLTLRGGVEGAGSDATFAQVLASVRWYKGLGPPNRLIVRGEVGHTYADAVTLLAPSLRFYAGGDRSIRGYAWREVGPRIETGAGEFALGGKHLATASVEFERYFNDTWGGAVFVDTGTAFDERPDWHTGVGIGLRWRSPVGPVRVDIARGLDDPDASFQLYLGIGADL